MRTVGLITGSGFYEIDAGFHPRLRRLDTPYGEVSLQEAELAGHRLLALARHGAGHQLLSHQVRHHANIWSLRELGADAIVATSVVGIMDAGLPLATPIVFDELYFPSNRLPDGRPTTFFTTPGDPRRGHLILATPFSPSLRHRLIDAARAEGIDSVESGCYVHVDGPRFNTRTEIAALRTAGGTALSQTCGPETVLAAELELPFALLGFGVDYANGVQESPTPSEELSANLARHSAVATRIIIRLMTDLAPDAELPFDTGFVFRMES
jgi:5'-methylthioadenosine phosphorylase